MEIQDLRNIIKERGEKHPKKHGEWYRVHVYDNNYLVLDTWNGQVHHYANGAEPSDTKNLYHCVYVFRDKSGTPENYTNVQSNMIDFWYAHVSILCNNNLSLK